MASTSYRNWLQELLTGWEDTPYAYLIEIKKNKKDFFFADLIDAGGGTDQIIWTPAKRKAIAFKTEEMVEEFKYHFINPRKVSIIRINYDMDFLLGG